MVDLTEPIGVMIGVLKERDGRMFRDVAEEIVEALQASNYVIVPSGSDPVSKERAACAKFARDEAAHQQAVGKNVIDVVSKAAALKAAQVAERIARAIERGDR